MSAQTAQNWIISFSQNVESQPVYVTLQYYKISVEIFQLKLVILLDLF